MDALGEHMTMKHSPTLARYARQSAALKYSTPTPNLSEEDKTERLSRLVRTPDSPASMILWTALVLTGVFIGFAFLFWNLTPLYGSASCLLAACGAWAVRHDARSELIDEKLRGVEHELPFPAGGYRNWLASDIPVMDVHLSMPIDVAQFARAAALVVRGTVVDTLDPHLLRCWIPPSIAGTGDVHAFRRFVTMLLEPLHYEVGIERVELGGL
jgi:hypothetical protein